MESEGDHETLYAKRELANNIRIIDETLHSDTHPADLSAIFEKIKASYQSMYPPRGGLTEFYVWRDDVDARIKANKPLDSIKDELNTILKA